MWAGTGVALAIAVVVGIILQVTLDGLEGDGPPAHVRRHLLRRRPLLTWMIFWMRNHARALKGELEGKAARRHRRPVRASPSASSPASPCCAKASRRRCSSSRRRPTTAAASVIAGTLLGLAAATVLGVDRLPGRPQFNMRLFFQITGVLIVLFAAGLLSRAMLFLQARGDLGIVERGASTT